MDLQWDPLKVHSKHHFMQDHLFLIVTFQISINVMKKFNKQLLLQMPFHFWEPQLMNGKMLLILNLQIVIDKWQMLQTKLSHRVLEKIHQAVHNCHQEEKDSRRSEEKMVGILMLNQFQSTMNKYMAQWKSHLRKSDEEYRLFTGNSLRT